MKKTIYLLLLLTLPITTFAWGPTGHRTIASIANDELRPKVRKQIDQLLGKEGIIYYSTWADEVRSDAAYNYSSPWHYQNLSANKTPEQIKALWNAPLSEGEHLFYAVQELTARLKKDKKDVEALKFLIHFIGDLHQPMHLGRLEDLGGNRVPFVWFRDTINIHSLWDSYLIEHKKMSYSELANYLKNTVGHKKKAFVEQTIPDILVDSHQLTGQIYNYNSKSKSSYVYAYHFNQQLDEALYRAGVQLARLLNEIYQ